MASSRRNKLSLFCILAITSVICCISLALLLMVDRGGTALLSDSIFKKKSTKVPLPTIRVQYTFRHGVGFCDDQPKGIVAIISVHSAVFRSANREAIRKSWGRSEWTTDRKILLFFIVGETESAATQRNIDRESRKYGDIVQYDMLDSYRNLTYKSLAEMAFLEQECKSTNYKFFLKTDDDMFVNPGAVINFAQNHRSHRKTIFCELVYADAPVYRNPAAKWYLSWDEWGENRFPPHCPGSLYVFTSDLIPLILKKADKVPFLWIDDVYITGVVARAVGNVSHVVLPRRKYPLVQHTYQNMQMLWNLFNMVNRANSTEEPPVIAAETGKPSL